MDELEFSIQQNIGFGTVLDVGYVGSVSRHGYWRRNLNSIPFGSNFLPQNADPANPATPLAPAFLRPYMGFNDIHFVEPAGNSSYHSLQVTANRRFARGFQYGVSWTWSKSMDYNNWDEMVVSSLISPRVWDYGLADSDRTHIFKLNWMWDVPRLAVRQPAFRTVVNGWQLSGITSFHSGAPVGVGFTTVSPMDITGSPTDGARVVLTGNPVLPKGERTFSRYFRTEVFQLPARGTFGNAAKTQLRAPGINNWDVAVFKNFPVREPLRLQFRCELYNAWNHSQFVRADTTARFDAQGRQVNARFGEITAARAARIIQLALRFSF